MQQIRTQRRAVLYGLISTATAARWSPPVITAVMLPRHASASSTTEPPPEPQCEQDMVYNVSKPEAMISWAENFEIPQYSGPGVLSKVAISIVGKIRSAVGVENLDASTKAVYSEIDAALVLGLPSGETLTLPINDIRETVLEPNDGNIDYAAPAGMQFEQVVEDSVAHEYLLTDTFVGSGSVSFTVEATGTLSLSGPAAMASYSQTFAKMDIQVEYICGG